MPSSNRSQTFADYVRATGARRVATPPKVTTRRAAVKRPREHDTGHVITGVGFAFECSCGASGKVTRSYRAAMDEGRKHAAEHTPKAWREGRFP